jgi:hypothetical protein
MENPARAIDVKRNKPEGYARYMRMNPLYFEGLWRAPFSEDTLQKALWTMFPETKHGREDMANKPAICANCERGPMIVRNKLCGTCDKAAGTLIGAAREKALIEIRGKIERGEVKPRGKNAAKLRVEEKAPVRSESGVMTTGIPGPAPDKVEARFDRLANMVKELEALGCQVSVSLSIGMGDRS